MEVIIYSEITTESNVIIVMEIPKEVKNMPLPWVVGGLIVGFIGRAVAKS